MIPEETIDRVRQATDIAQVIGEYIRLKKHGKNYKALCPFHTEKTPSFNVSVEKQIFHCFGCGKGGNVFTFLMEHEKMSFVEVVKMLARRAGITIREDARSDFRRELVERVSYANQVALDYFRRTLSNPKYRSILEDYLKGKRRISAEVIEQFQLGLAGTEWDGLIHHAARHDLTVEDLSRAGLVSLSEKKQNYFDRFRQRLMIPIFNLSQKPIAFGGRTLKKGEPAKYVNSPETALYVKGNVLYGLNFAKDTIRQTRTAFVVEGYFDLISLWQIGVKNVVASSGTAFTAQQARLLARFAEEVYLFFDADSAGQNAALRSVGALYDSGLEVRVMVPPAGEDPDSIAVKYGPDKVEQLRQGALGFIPFRVRTVDTDSLGIIGKEKLIKELAAVGTGIADPTRRDLFFAEAAEALEVDTQIFRRSSPPVGHGDNSVTPARRKFNPHEFQFLSLLFHNPGSIDAVLEKISPDDFDSKELSRLYAAMVNQYREKSVIDARTLAENTQDPDFVSLVTEIASKEWPPEVIDSETYGRMKDLLKGKRKRIIASLTEEMHAAGKAGDQEREQRLLNEINTYVRDDNET